MKKMIIFLASICICISFVGYIKSSSTHSTFDENKAISMVIKDHTDFPSNPKDTITKEVPIGVGDYTPGATTKIMHTIKIEQFAKDTYIITLTEDWAILSNAKSYWKYKVMPNSITLIESVDNRSAIRAIK